MAIAEYLEGSDVRVGYCAKGLYTRLIFKQYYDNTKEVSWQSFSFLNPEALEKMLLDDRMSKKYLEGGPVEMTRAQMNIHTATRHLCNEAVDNILNGFPPKAFTVTVTCADVSAREFLVSDMNAQTLLEVLYELYPELALKPVTEHKSKPVNHNQYDLSP